MFGKNETKVNIEFNQDILKMLKQAMREQGFTPEELKGASRFVRSIKLSDDGTKVICDESVNDTIEVMEGAEE